MGLVNEQLSHVPSYPQETWGGRKLKNTAQRRPLSPDTSISDVHL